MADYKLYAGMTYNDIIEKYSDTVTRVCALHCGNIEDTKDCSDRFSGFAMNDNNDGTVKIDAGWSFLSYTDISDIVAIRFMGMDIPVE